MKIFKIKGIEIKFHISTLVIVAIVGFYAASIYYTTLKGNVQIWELILVGLINGIFILLSILAHELMHSLMALRKGIKVSEIDLYLFGGVSKIEEEPDNPKNEFLISIVGPITSLIIGSILMILYFLPVKYNPMIYITLYYIGLSNILLGIFNAIPAFPMDGGRVLRAYLWHKRKNILSATKTASKVGVFFGYAMIIFGFVEIIFIGVFSGFWFVLIGWFLISSAKNSYAHTIVEVKLSNLFAKNILHPLTISIPFNMLIIDSIRYYFMVYKKSYFPISEGDKIVGIIDLKTIQKISIDERRNMLVDNAMYKISDFPIINGDESGKKALMSLRKIRNTPKLLIVVERDTDKILGIIGEEDIRAALEYADIIKHHEINFNS